MRAKRPSANALKSAKEADPVPANPPSDRQLLCDIRRHLDVIGLKADYRDINDADIENLFRRLMLLLPDEPAQPNRAAFSIARENNADLVLYTDGGSRGNPGLAGYGAVLAESSGRVLREVSDYIGRATNNEAEYFALIAGLRLAIEHGAANLVIHSDSQLMIRQINGQYKVKSAKLKPLFAQVRALLSKIPAWRAQHVPREANARADELANEAMDRAPAGPET